MVWRKDRPPCGVENSMNNTMSNEQPVTKRQRIENSNIVEAETDANLQAAPDITANPSTSSVAASISNNNNKNNSNSICDGSAQLESDEPDNAIAPIIGLLPVSGPPPPTLLCKDNGISEFLSSASCTSIIPGSFDSDLLLFQSQLLTQCLCGVSERTLKRPFQSHYNYSANGNVKRIATLTEWPTKKLIQFLSNLQLLFDVYLKQNKTGSICGRIKDVCDALIVNEHNLINEIIELSDYNDKYVQYMAGRVMSSFLVTAQDSQYCHDWLKKLVDNLFSFEDLNYSATQKITFSLDIFKRIVEWKDADEHPVEDEIDPASEVVFAPPPIENNYFHFYAEYNSPTMPSSSQININPGYERNHRNASGTSRHDTPIITNNITSSSSPDSSANDHHDGDVCHLVHLSDYEGFDTTKLKCDTVKIIENKWPALLRNMNMLITSYGDIDYGETLILTFLELWKSIISVQANLSVNDTHPFHAQLDRFEEMHLNHNLPATIYKQMLTLFNEALCYGSTLSLQDIIPDETCNLAHRIINHIKDDTQMGLLYSVPTRPTENPVSLIGYTGRSITHAMRSFQYEHENGVDDENSGDGNGNTAGTIQQQQQYPAMQVQRQSTSYAIDKTFLQKTVLLVLKSVAVTVREMRSDSSDSSIDSNDYQAYSDLILIEQNMHTVLKKLDVFTKNKLQLHPEHHFSKMLVYLFDDQDDFLIEAMVCTLDVTAGFTIRTTAFTENPFGELIKLLNPVYTFLEFLNMTAKSWGLLLDLLVSNETCFLLYLLRFLKYISKDWDMFDQSCRKFGDINGLRDVRDDVMAVLHDLRFEISRMVASSTFPYDISPILRLLEICENRHEGDL